MELTASVTCAQRAKAAIAEATRGAHVVAVVSWLQTQRQPKDGSSVAEACPIENEFAIVRTKGRYSVLYINTPAFTLEFPAWETPRLPDPPLPLFNVWEFESADNAEAKTGKPLEQKPRWHVADCVVTADSMVYTLKRPGLYNYDPDSHLTVEQRSRVRDLFSDVAASDILRTTLTHKPLPTVLVDLVVNYLVVKRMKWKVKQCIWGCCNWDACPPSPERCLHLMDALLTVKCEPVKSKLDSEA